MAKEKQEKKLYLEDALWNCRDALRTIGTPDANRDAIITLVFIKFCTDKFNKQKEKLEKQYADNPHRDFFLNDKAFYLKDNVFFLREEARWDYIVTNAGQNDIVTKLDKALKAMEEDNPSLKGALQKDLFTSLGIVGEKISRLKTVIDNINMINEDKYPEEDLIGRVYEYFLKSYAAAGSSESGEFYTPSSIVKLIAELIEPYKGIVYDPCCGSGGMFVQSMKFVEEHKKDPDDIQIFGQEVKEPTWRLCKMNLAIRGINGDLGTRAADTFTDDLHKGLKADYIMANPPFNLHPYWSKSMEPPKDKRWIYGVPRESNANYAWIMHMISKLKPHSGVAGFLLANGALGDGDDSENRTRLLNDDKVEAIIVLPRDMFYTTDISVTLWIIRMDKNAGEINGRKVRDRRGEILFMDLRTWGRNTSPIKIDKNSTKKANYFTDEEISKIKEIYNAWQSPNKEGYADVPELCRSTKIYEKDLTEEEKRNGIVSIESQGYVLMPSRYIEFVDHDLDIDYEKEMTRIQVEMNMVLNEEKETQKLLEEAFEEIGYGIDKL